MTSGRLEVRLIQERRYKDRKFGMAIEVNKLVVNNERLNSSLFSSLTWTGRTSAIGLLIVNISVQRLHSYTKRRLSDAFSVCRSELYL